MGTNRGGKIINLKKTNRQEVSIVLAKHEVINALRDMPETISFAEIKETVEIIEANRRAMEDIKAGRIYNTNEAKKYIREQAKLQ